MNIYLASFSILSGSIISFAFGTWSEHITFLLVLMAIDYVTGITAAVKEKSGLDSAVGFWGLLKKGFMLLVIMLAHQVDLLLGQELAKGGAVMFYIVNELLSVTENMGRMGLPLPPQLLSIVKVLREREEAKEKKILEAQQESKGDDTKS